MPPWAGDLLLARVSQIPRAALLAGPGPVRLRRAPGLRGAPDLLSGSGGLKRKSEPEEAEGGCPAVPTPPPPMESEECDARSPASGAGTAEGALRSVKNESPSWSTIPGKNSFASDYSGGKDDDGTYLCPASAIEHPIPYLVYTNAYEGDDCMGAYWAAANTGDGVAMRIVEGPAGTAVDPMTDGDGEDSLPPTADYGDGGAGGPRGADDVGLCPHRLHGDSGSPAVPPLPPDRRGRSPPGTPMGPRETARYGLRAVRLGEASHPGPTDSAPGDREYILPAAAVAARVARIDDMVAAMRARPRGSAIVGAHTPGAPARGAPPGQLPAAPRSGAACPGYANSAGSFPSSDGRERIIGPITRLPPASTLGSGVKQELALVTGTRCLQRPTAPAEKVDGL